VSSNGTENRRKGFLDARCEIRHAASRRAARTDLAGLPSYGAWGRVGCGAGQHGSPQGSSNLNDGIARFERSWLSTRVRRFTSDQDECFHSRRRQWPSKRGRGAKSCPQMSQSRVGFES
jgi:hypothetical protein